MNFFDKLSFSYLEHKINNSYTNRLMKYGNSPQGLFWKNSFTQIHRFELIITALNKYSSLKNSKNFPYPQPISQIVNFLRLEYLFKALIINSNLCIWVNEFFQNRP